jgi:hypothetical protein
MALGTCSICGGPLDAEGKCEVVSEAWHGEGESVGVLPTLDELANLEDIE